MSEHARDRRAILRFTLVIDLHCHILHALDDGAIDLDDSLAMARQAESDGIEIVCATPHIRPDHEVSIPELDERVLALNREFGKEGVAVRVARGGEVAETMVESMDDTTLRQVTLGGNGTWLLLEPRPGPLGGETVAVVDGLAERGFRAIVAHPERHPGERFQEWLEALAARGALIQVTAALVADGPAAPTILALAGKGLVHLLGSDAHSSHGGRPLRISDGLARLGEVERLQAHLDWIATDGPAAILRGEPVTPPFAPA
jgi:protein-tyrosine phosphatase